MKAVHIIELFRKDTIQEWRQKYALNGIVLYVFSTLFIIVTGFVQLNPDEWVSLFWIVMLFASANAGAKSFIQESQGKLLYYYTISSAQEILLSKLTYNFLLLLFVGFIGYFGFNVFFSLAPDNKSFFVLLIVLGALGFAGIFTLISAIASKARGSATLMTILSFPLILPQLILLLRLSKKAFLDVALSEAQNQVIALISLDAIVVIVAYLLFPYLWRE